MRGMDRGREISLMFGKMGPIGPHVFVMV